MSVETLLSNELALSSEQLFSILFRFLHEKHENAHLAETSVNDLIALLEAEEVGRP
jgi:hypothetical protein